MAMMMKPKLLLCDEPTSALDPAVQAEVAGYLAALRREGTAILLITHNLGLAAALSDYLAVMEKGRLVEYGRKEDILQTPQAPYTKKLLQSVWEVV